MNTREQKQQNRNKQSSTQNDNWMKNLNIKTLQMVNKKTHILLKIIFTKFCSMVFNAPVS